MRNNPYKDLPPLERRPDGSLYRMTPAQRKQAVSLIRRECCCCEDGSREQEVEIFYRFIGKIE